MVAAVVQAACRYCITWIEKLDKIETELQIPWLQLEWGAYGRPEFEAVLGDINGISLLGLPTPAHVEMLVKMRQDLIHAHGAFQRLMAVDVSDRPQPGDWNGVSVAKMFLGSAKESGGKFIKLSETDD